MGRGRLALFFSGAVGLLTLDCGGGLTSKPDPSIVVDPTTCTAGLTTLARIDQTQTDVQGLAVGSDGTVFFTEGLALSASMGGGVYAIPPAGGAPTRISDFSIGAHAWVDGGMLWLATPLGALYSLPVAGGQATLVGQIGLPANIDEVIMEKFLLDEAFLYVTVLHLPDSLEVWRVARVGGHADLLFTSSDAKWSQTALNPLAADSQSLYFFANPDEPGGALYRLPKVGGIPVVVRSDFSGGNAMLYFGGFLFADDMPIRSPDDSDLGRFPVDPSQPPTRIDGVGIGTTNAFFADKMGAYVAYGTGHQGPDYSLAIARLPTSAESSPVLGCTQPIDGLVREMGLSPSHVYALVQDLGSKEYSVVRATR